MRFKLTHAEHEQLREIADIEDRDEVYDIIQRTRIITEREDLAKVRDLAAQVVEVGAHERYGFEEIEDLYERATDELFSVD